jgi:hypothetical protein
MTPPRDRPRRSELSDTGRELLAIFEERIEELRSERHTPVESFPAVSESTEHMRSIARGEAKGEVTTHTLGCLMPGGVLHAVADKLEQRMITVEKVQKEHGDAITQYLEEKKFRRFVMPILIGFLGSSAGVALMMLLFKALIHNALAGVVKP